MSTKKTGLGGKGLAALFGSSAAKQEDKLEKVSDADKKLQQAEDSAVREKSPATVSSSTRVKSSAKEKKPAGSAQPVSTKTTKKANQVIVEQEFSQDIDEVLTQDNDRLSQALEAAETFENRPRASRTGVQNGRAQSSRRERADIEEYVHNMGDAQIREVSIERVHPNPDQPRKYFSQESLEELSKSIAQKGVLQPLLVEEEDGEYIIIAGERRYRASQLAGLKTLPVIVYEFSDAERYEIAIIENVQREDLNPMEEARAYKRLMDKTGMTQAEVAAKIAKSRSAVANALRLNSLPRQAQNSLEAGEISPGHGRAILSVHTPENQRVLYRKIVSQRLSVREAEREAQVLNGTISPSFPVMGKAQQSLSPAMADIQDSLMEALGTKTRIKGQEHKGSIEISYYSEEDLDRIFRIITRS